MTYTDELQPLVALEGQITEAAGELLRLCAERWPLDTNNAAIRVVQQEAARMWPAGVPDHPPRYTKKKLPTGLRTEVMERDEYRCARCGTHRGLGVDHIIPESKGGPATLENLQTLCGPCNSSKGVSTP